MKVWLKLKRDVSNARGQFSAGDYVNWPEETAWPLIPWAAVVVSGPPKPRPVKKKSKEN